MGKKEYRKYITEACHRKNEDNLRKQMSVMKKCERIRKEEYGRKQYFHLKTPYETRERYATRVFMLPWAGNFTHDGAILSSFLRQQP